MVLDNAFGKKVRKKGIRTPPIELHDRRVKGSVTGILYQKIKRFCSFVLFKNGKIPRDRDPSKDEIRSATRKNAMYRLTSVEHVTYCSRLFKDDQHQISPDSINT